jgi:putative ABC transport system permease protein
MIEEKWLPRFPRFEASPLDFISWQEQTSSFSNLAAFRDFPFNLTADDRPERVQGARVSANLTSLLGVKPLLGRTFRPEEDRDGGSSVVLLSHSLWRRRFGEDSGVVGKSIRLNGNSFTVVGVMPAGFQFPRDAEIWTLMQFTPRDLESRGNHVVWVVARLKPDLTREQAQAEMDLIMPRLQKVWTANVVALTDHYVGEIRLALLVLLGAAGLVLLVACANIASLLLARASVRQKEIALRAALGASRKRIIQQLLTEAIVLAACGGMLGILLGYYGVSVVRKLPLAGIARLDQVGVDYSVLMFTLVLSVLTAVLFGLAPAFRLSRVDLQDGLKLGGRVSGAGARIRKVLVVSEVALALLLLTGAGLLMKSLSKLLEVDSGLNPRSVLTATVNLPAVNYREPYQQTQFVAQLLQRLSGLPEVRAAAVSTGLPFSGVQDSGIRFDGRPDGSPLVGTTANHYRVTPAYFQVMQIPLVRGRAFTERDTLRSQPVVVINETMAQRFFPDEDPIGKRLDISGPTYMREIVGVVGDVKQEGLRRPTAPQVYEAFPQKPSAVFRIVVKGAADPTSLAELVRREVTAIDKYQPVSAVRALEDIVAETVMRDRLSTLLLTLFALFALGLASIGIYGVIAYSVAQRTREIGIRRALGADNSRILQLMLGQSVRMVLLGLALGLVASFALTQVLESLLYEVTPYDPSAFISVSILLLSATMLAAAVPAVRALRVPPIVALRLE